jgi:hypothetical protein
MTSSMTTLALGMTLNFYVVVDKDKVIAAPGIALISAIVMLICLYGLWFGCSLYQRQR